MSATIITYVDGMFCDSSYEVPNIEPDAHALRLYQNIANGSPEQMIMACDNPDTATVDRWLRTFGMKFSMTFAPGLEDSRKRMERLVQLIALQQSKIVLFIGGRFIDCNHMADLGVPSLRYIAPNSAATWEPDPRDSWEKVVSKQGGE
jgi:3-deoxy-D-manno-octulosonate 8-phosphate phosphatase KdsC-like HAD superfamily phosphatase